MQAWPWRTLVFAGVGLTLLYAATRSDPRNESLDKATPNELIEMLGSSRPVVRHAAAAQMVSRGEEIIPALMQAVRRVDEEQLQEILSVLEEYVVASDDTAYDAAEEALLQLANDGSEDVRRRAERVLKYSQSRRHMQAYSRIESLGARILPRMASGGREMVAPAELVMLGPEWTGTPDDLLLFSRLADLRSVHVKADSSLRSEDIVNLKSLLPEVIVRRAGEACLGIEADGHELTVVVQQVTPDSPASRAGLRRQDVITKVENSMPGTAREFFDRIAAHAPGDEITLEVLRGRETLKLTLKLGDDFEAGRCVCEGEGRKRGAWHGLQRSTGRMLPPSDRLVGPSLNRLIRTRQN